MGGQPGSDAHQGQQRGIAVQAGSAGGGKLDAPDDLGQPGGQFPLAGEAAGQGRGAGAPVALLGARGIAPQGGIGPAIEQAFGRDRADRQPAQGGKQAGAPGAERIGPARLPGQGRRQPGHGPTGLVDGPQRRIVPAGAAGGRLGDPAQGEGQRRGIMQQGEGERQRIGGLEAEDQGDGGRVVAEQRPRPGRTGERGQRPDGGREPGQAGHGVEQQPCGAAPVRAHRRDRFRHGVASLRCRAQARALRARAG